jgi:hypothetical protein
MKSIFLTVLTCCCLGLVLPVYGQFEVFGSIEGYVYDSLTNEPVIGANVFISNSMIGAATDLEGYYFLERVPVGDFELVFSHITYDARSFVVSVVSAEFTTLSVSILPNIKELQEVTVKAKVDRDWRRSLGFFEKYFLGSSFNANKCTIRNPEVLDFQYDPLTKVTNVIGEEELIIDNEALGFTVYYILEQFEFDDDYKIMLGKSRFQPMEAPDEKTSDKWEKNRERAYYGSMQHFFTSLMKDELKENGFKIYRLQTLPESSTEPRYEIKPSQMMSFGGLNMKRKVFFPDYLEIVYEDEPEPNAYRQYVDRAPKGDKTVQVESRSAQTSLLSLRGKPLEVDKSGYVYNPTDYIVYGYWAWERMAELMPFDYVPGM